MDKRRQAFNFSLESEALILSVEEHKSFLFVKFLCELTAQDKDKVARGVTSVSRVLRTAHVVKKKWTSPESDIACQSNPK